jgi:hypothetical protein
VTGQWPIFAKRASEGSGFTPTPPVLVNMSTNGESADSSGVPPEEAFGILGGEARVEILRRLAEVDGPETYSDLFDSIAYDDISNFNYHLDKLVGHFVGKSGDGYVLRRPGERIVEAVLSGAVTSDPVRERTRTSRPCPICSGPIEVGYEEERVTLHCPECPGLIERVDADGDRATEPGNLGYRPLPPAAVAGRTAEEMHDVSKTWTSLTVHAMARGICPRCSGKVDHEVEVCESHDKSDGTCGQCGRVHGTVFSAICTNCTFDVHAGVAGFLGAKTEVMAFLIEHGIDPLSPGDFHPYSAVEETILSTDPFEAQYTVTVEDDTLTMIVDAELSVIEVTRE